MNLSDAPLRRIFSRLYADACLNEKINMRDFTANFESIREQILAMTGTRCWNMMKLDKNYFSNQVNLDFLLRLQQAYYEELSNTIINQVKELNKTQPQQAWEMW